MTIPSCPYDGCDEPTRIKKATDFPTLISNDKTSRTTFDVKFCDDGHVIQYIGRTEPIGPDAPIRQ